MISPDGLSLGTETSRLANRNSWLRSPLNRIAGSSDWRRVVATSSLTFEAPSASGATRLNAGSGLLAQPATAGAASAIMNQKSNLSRRRITLFPVPGYLRRIDTHTRRFGQPVMTFWAGHPVWFFTKTSHWLQDRLCPMIG